jgi:16S rRNA (guanine966-N2)-methyltransferase
MSIRVLGGFAKNFLLVTPKTDTTRPTSVLLRRRLFDWRQNLEGYQFVDLFAGSGAMGIEALSRGAECVFLNDSNKLAFKSISLNCEKIKSSYKIDSSIIDLSQLDGLLWVKRNLVGLSDFFTEMILYIDPPYEKHQLYYDLFNELKMIGYSGEVWVESDKLKGVSEDQLAGNFKKINKRFYQGDHFVLVGNLL